MENTTPLSGHATGRRTSTGVIILAFIVALEIVIMISPFAAFFYAVFNPFLLTLNRTSATRWLTAFFLPHMIVPPDGMLSAIRIAGSVMFLAGMAIFFICAAQVYLGKLLKQGTATKGLYLLVRHPQYGSLAIAALGLAIMWPRLLTLVLLVIMLFSYYVLAKDEERRMITLYGESYTSYMGRTGMFFPRIFGKKTGQEDPTTRKSAFLRSMIVFLSLFIVIVGSGFLLRDYTVHHLPLAQVGNIDVLAISPDDSEQVRLLVPAVLEDSAVVSRLHSIPVDSGHRLLAYFMPIDYVMQGMIANTGDEWKLFDQHKTIGMITEYILHPVAHLQGGHAHHMNMAGMKHGPEMYAMATMKRRVIIIEVTGDDLVSPFDDFGLNVQRTPLLFVDVHLHTAEILQVKETPSGSGWGAVPTPMF